MTNDPYAIGSFILFGIVIGIFVAAAIGAWAERRNYGKRVFRVQNHHLTHDEVFHVFDRQPSACEDERRKYAKKVRLQ